MAEYFGDRLLYIYFLNCIGYVHYYLPGLFSANPYPLVVNGQLWTVPIELQCYIWLGAIALIGLTLNSRWFVAFLVCALAYGMLPLLLGTPGPQEAVTGPMLIICFLVGVFLYLHRGMIPYSAWLGWLAIALSLAAVWSPTGTGTFLAAVPTAYATVFIGLSNPARLHFLQSGDYSYGIFLYGFPIQQAAVATGLVPLNGVATCLVALPFIFVMAACSWHFWEKPALRLRRYRPHVDRLFAFTAPGFAVPVRQSRMIGLLRRS
jgi:peptidoglycan/LPS O-acetylase OafA/YrhL